MKKFAMLLFMSAMVLTGCGNNSGDIGGSKPKVDIKHLSASLSTSPESNDLVSEDDKATTSTLEETQYIVIYKSELDIDFKVELDNPQFSEITAIKFACDDPNATVAVENSKGETTWNSIKDYPIVKWGGTDMYKRTFEIRLSEGFTSDECALSVLDLQVNNEWQNKKLSNDVLDVYRMNENDLNWKFITNTPEYYEWKFETNENVENVKVYCDNEIITSENGKYRVNKNCEVKYTWEFKVGENRVEWENSKEIEVLKVTDNPLGSNYISNWFIMNIQGTGVYEELKTIDLYVRDNNNFRFIVCCDKIGINPFTDERAWYFEPAIEDNHPLYIERLANGLEVYANIFGHYYNAK